MAMALDPIMISLTFVFIFVFNSTKKQDNGEGVFAFFCEGPITPNHFVSTQMPCRPEHGHPLVSLCTRSVASRLECSKRLLHLLHRYT